MPVLQGDKGSLGAGALRRAVDESVLLLDWWMDNGVVAWVMDDERAFAVARDPLYPVVNQTLGRHLPSREFEVRL